MVYYGYLWSKLDEAIKPLRKHLLGNHPESPDGDENVKMNNPFSTGDTAEWEDSMRLRLDYECLLDASWPEAVGGILQTVNTDLMEILVDGDKDHPDDPMLKSFNGSKKRGKEIKSIKIDQTRCYMENQPKKDSQEHTIFMLVQVEWEE